MDKAEQGVMTYYDDLLSFILGASTLQLSNDSVLALKEELQRAWNTETHATCLHDWLEEKKSMVKNPLKDGQEIFRTCDVCECQQATRELPMKSEIVDDCLVIYPGGTKAFCNDCFRQRGADMRAKHPRHSTRVVEPNELVVCCGDDHFASVKDYADLAAALNTCKDPKFTVKDKSHTLSYEELANCYVKTN